MVIKKVNNPTKILNLYKYLFRLHMGVEWSGNEVKNKSIIKNMLNEFSVVQVSLLVFMQFEWRGHQNNNEQYLRALSENGYPLGWLPSRCSLYISFIKGYVGADWDNEEELADLLRKWVSLTFKQNNA